MPPAIQVDILSDRTQTIRASVADVEFTLLLTIALVVIVIFVFLRSLWATIIPSVTVPLSLLGTCALMYVVGYSLDNLSLMALTIAVGFVVDDAIVMLENIVRHIEDGKSVVEAALKGAGEIGFTIMSISLSLIAVFIPLLLMGGIIGRLFREFAVTVTMTIVVSAFVSLTLTPMMCVALLKSEKEEKHGRLYVLDRARLRRAAGRLRRTPRRRAAPPASLTLLVFVATVAGTAYLFVVIPKGFFPQQDTGLIIGTSEAAQDISFAEMMRRQQALGDVVASDPAVATIAMAIGAGGSSSSIEQRPLLHHPEAAGPARRLGRTRSSRGCGPSSTRSRAPSSSCRRRRTSTSAAAPRARSSSTRCRTPTSTSSTPGRRRSWTS